MGRHLTGVILIWVAGGCGPTAPPPPLVILAPDHLAPLIEGLLGAAAVGAPVRLRTDTPDRVTRQVNSGTPADLVVTGAPALMDALVADGHVNDASRRPLAFDELVWVTPVRDASAGPPPPLRRLLIPAAGDPPPPPVDPWGPALAAERVVGGDESDLLRALEPGEAAVVRETLALSADRALSRLSGGGAAQVGLVVEIAPLEASRDPGAAAAIAAALSTSDAARLKVDAMGLGWPRGAPPPQPQPVR